MKAVGGPRHTRRAPTVGEALKACGRCTIMVRYGREVECPECFRWVRLTRTGTLPRHRALIADAMLDADGRCFGTGHKLHQAWGFTKVIANGGFSFRQAFDQFGNLTFGEHPYSLDACQLAGTHNAKPKAPKRRAGGKT